MRGVGGEVEGGSGRREGRRGCGWDVKSKQNRTEILLTSLGLKTAIMFYLFALSGYRLLLGKSVIEYCVFTKK